jgi:AAA domain
MATKSDDVSSAGGLHNGIATDEPLPGAPPKPEPLPAKAFTWSELEAISDRVPCLFHVDAQMLGEGIMPRGIVGLLAGPPGSGKSFLALEMILAVARGGRLFGTTLSNVPYVQPPDAGRVLYLSLEDDRHTVGRRLRRIVERGGKAAATMEALDQVRVVAWDDIEAGCARVLFRPRADRVGLDATDLYLRACATLEDGQPWALIVVDTLARAARGGVEVDAEAATDMIQQLEQWTKLPGAPTVLLVHHNRKEGSATDKPFKRLASLMAADNVRGTGALGGSVRWIGMLGKLTASVEEVEKYGCPRRNVFFEVVKANAVSEDAMPRMHLTPDPSPGAQSTGVLRVASPVEQRAFNEWLEQSEARKSPSKSNGAGELEYVKGSL